MLRVRRGLQMLRGMVRSFQFIWWRCLALNVFRLTLNFNIFRFSPSVSTDLQSLFGGCFLSSFIITSVRRGADMTMDMTSTQLSWNREQSHHLVFWPDTRTSGNLATDIRVQPPSIMRWGSLHGPALFKWTCSFSPTIAILGIEILRCILHNTTNGIE